MDKLHLNNNILIEDICFSYENQRKTIFDNYSASFPMEQVSIIMSPSGRGKTTLLNLIAGLLKPSSGSISIPVDNPRFAAVFQDLRLIENISIKKNILLVNQALSDSEIAEALNALGLFCDDKTSAADKSNYADIKVAQLSGGEKQRVAIIRALLSPSDILLLDEPFSNLDTDSKNKAIKYIKEKTAHKTVLLVTHDENDAKLFNCTINYLT